MIKIYLTLLLFICSCSFRLCGAQENATPRPVAVLSSFWSAWSGWSVCIQGQQMRVRACQTIRGYRCYGQNRQTQSCGDGKPRPSPTANQSVVYNREGRAEVAGPVFEPFDPWEEDRKIAMAQLYGHKTRPNRPQTVPEPPRDRKNNPFNLDSAEHPTFPPTSSAAPTKATTTTPSPTGVPESTAPPPLVFPSSRKTVPWGFRRSRFQKRRRLEALKRYRIKLAENSTTVGPGKTTTGSSTTSPVVSTRKQFVLEKKTKTESPVLRRFGADSDENFKVGPGGQRAIRVDGRTYIVIVPSDGNTKLGQNFLTGSGYPAPSQPAYPAPSQPSYPQPSYQPLVPPHQNPPSTVPQAPSFQPASYGQPSVPAPSSYSGGSPTSVPNPPSLPSPSVVAYPPSPGAVSYGQRQGPSSYNTEAPVQSYPSIPNVPSPTYNPAPQPGYGPSAPTAAPTQPAPPTGYPAPNSAYPARIRNPPGPSVVPNPPASYSAHQPAQKPPGYHGTNPGAYPSPSSLGFPPSIPGPQPPGSHGPQPGPRKLVSPPGFNPRPLPPPPGSHGPQPGPQKPVSSPGFDPRPPTAQISPPGHVVAPPSAVVSPPAQRFHNGVVGHPTLTISAPAFNAANSNQKSRTQDNSAGVQTAIRSVTAPGNSEGDRKQLREVQESFGGNGQWSAWSGWSSCRCGRKSRTRKCDFANSLLNLGCIGISYEIRACEDKTCLSPGVRPQKRKELPAKQPAAKEEGTVSSGSSRQQESSQRGSDSIGHRFEFSRSSSISLQPRPQTFSSFFGGKTAAQVIREMRLRKNPEENKRERVSHNVRPVSNTNLPSSPNFKILTENELQGGITSGIIGPPSEISGRLNQRSDQNAPESIVAHPVKLSPSTDQSRNPHSLASSSLMQEIPTAEPEQSETIIIPVGRKELPSAKTDAGPESSLLPIRKRHRFDLERYRTLVRWQNNKRRS